MAPRDDFVLTIDSDDDNLLQGLEEEEDSETEPSTPKPENGKKRKRQADKIAADVAKGAKKRKKGSHGTGAEGKHDDDDDDEDDDDEPQGWADRAGQRDGALNPDFEFQLEQDAGIEKDFDAWDREADVADPRKKGVDMDELIARRKAKSAPGLNRGDDEKDEKVDGGPKDDSEMDEPNTMDAESDEEVGFGTGVPLGEGEESDGDDVHVGDGDHGDDDDSDDGEDNDDDNDSDVADDMDADHVDLKADSDGEAASEDEAEAARQKAFFAPESEENSTKIAGSRDTNFQHLKLSRPILRGLTAVGFSKPTPIQAKTIPIALMGKDVVGGAVTGSGKTGAFMIPILERLLYRDRKIPTTRVAVLMPTRELAVQCFNVAKKLASFTDITFCQLVGGFSLREQENILKKRPDVVIATPGRFIDHMRNSASFTIDTLEILVLDEADRMLEEGFADELNEILTTIPKSRQTMLFSATMTNTVDKLIRVGLNRPVRLMVDSKRQTVGTLTQEFVRLRAGREDKRLAYLLHLCTTAFEQRCIIFFRQKKEAHRVRIIFGLCGLKVAELHGSMSQEQRIQSVESFRAGSVTHLLATDVASRGLDIKGVETVINYESPQSHEIYLHRVGRTARAGREGRACTLAAESDRKVVRAAVKIGREQGAKIVSRVVETDAADRWAERVEALEPDVVALLKEEKEEKQMQNVEMQVRKGENLLAHEKEIMARPKRDWFQTEKDKLAAKQAGIAELNGTHGKKKKVKLSNKDKKKLDATRERKEGRLWKKGKADRGMAPVKAKAAKGKKKTGAKR